MPASPAPVPVLGGVRALTLTFFAERTHFRPPRQTAPARSRTRGRHRAS